MREPLIIQKLIDTKGTLAKQEIVQTYSINPDFIKGCHACYNPLTVYNIKKKPKVTEHSNEFDGGFPREFCDLLNALSSRTLTGKAAIGAVVDFASRCTEDAWELWFWRIINKDFKCGVGVTSFNTVMELIGYEQVKVFGLALAQSAKDNPHKMVGEKIIDMKYDGVRLVSMLNVDDRTITHVAGRNGKIHTNHPHITKELERLFDHLTESVVIDGELMGENFQELMTTMNRKKPKAATESVCNGDETLHCFDFLPLSDFLSGQCDIPLKTRRDNLSELLGKVEMEHVKYIPYDVITLPEDEEKYEKAFEDALDNGYEGIMIKEANGPYICRKTNVWLKRKQRITVDLYVTAVNRGKIGTSLYNTVGSITCEGIDDGKKIVVNVPSFTDEQREYIWNNKHMIIGRIVEIGGDALTKAKNSTVYSLRFPSFERFRDTEDDIGTKI